jgi:hypothetical protein
MCLGVTAGAHVLTLFAVSVNYHEQNFQLFALQELALPEIIKNFVCSG